MAAPTSLAAAGRRCRAGWPAAAWPGRPASACSQQEQAGKQPCSSGSAKASQMPALRNKIPNQPCTCATEQPTQPNKRRRSHELTSSLPPSAGCSLRGPPNHGPQPPAAAAGWMPQWCQAAPQPLAARRRSGCCNRRPAWLPRCCQTPRPRPQHKTRCAELARRSPLASCCACWRGLRCRALPAMQMRRRCYVQSGTRPGAPPCCGQ